MNRLGLSGRPFIFVVDYKQEQVWVAEPEEVEPREVLYDLNGVTNVTSKAETFPEKYVEWETNPVSFETYSRSFRTVIEHIYAGNSYLVNLTCATPVRTNLTLKEIFYLSHAPYKLWVKERFVVFSPEIFVRIEDGFIYSYPMKGTIDASLPNARERILADKKEEAEHATIVDLIRNDLSQVASEVTVSRYRYIDELKTNRGRLLQVRKLVVSYRKTGKPHWETYCSGCCPQGLSPELPRKRRWRLSGKLKHTNGDFIPGLWVILTAIVWTVP